MVVVDTLRADRLPFYGYERDTAPFLANLARHGVLFERAWSASSWTAPSTASR
ncbi:sulfatase-like hydrolase/transferase [Engelhardtia mirabilis]